MVNRWILQPAFLLWFLPTALSINYKQLELRQRSSISECLELLNQMNGPLCLSYRQNFKIPMEVKHPRQLEKDEAVSVIEVMLQNIFHIFRSNSSSTGWNKNIIESFLDKLRNEMDFLEEIPENESLTPRNFTTILPLKSYYKRMQEYLENHEYSSCSWIVVRTEIRRNFSIMGRLIKIFQN
ncbi:interferon beta [Sigmodon hispidus]